MKHHRTLRVLAKSFESLEPRRLLARAFGPDPLSHGHDGACGGAALDEAYARNGADHDASWYAPARRVSVDASGDADPTFTTNAAGLPLLSSRPDGAGMKIFLDFDGNGSNLPFGIDADDSTYNTAEQIAIYDTWRDVVSYFSAFNVNVTTVQPATGGTLFAWHLTSKSISGGYAYVNSLTNSAPTGFNEAGDAVNRHSGIAHEIGHIMGLSHQGEWDKLGVNTTEYTEGFGVRDVAIMGVDYGQNVRTWIYGRTSSSASSLQNDIAVLAAKAASVVGGDGYRPDDFGATTGAAHVLPANVQRVPGAIERIADVDTFRFSVTSAGPWLIDATPTYESAVSPKIELLDSNGLPIASRDDADQRNVRNNDVEISVNLEPGTYYVRVSSSGDYSEIGEYLLTASPLPDGLLTADIPNTIDRGGTASYDPATGILTQLGAGTDIWSTSDQFRFSYDTFTGNGSITARVISLDSTDPNAKAGVMFRTSSLGNSSFVMMGVKPGGQIELFRRNGSGTSANVVASITPGGVPRWLRLTRTDNSFTGEYSDDGISWTTLGTTSVSLGTSVLGGFATTSHNSRKAAYAEFDNLALAGTLGEIAPSYNALPAPANLTAAPAPGANTNIVLNWSDIEGESGYAIERSVDGVNFARLSGTLGANATTYTDSTAWGSMRWWYRIVALSGASGSVPSALASAVNKPGAPTNPASAYAVPAISDSSGTAIYLNWADVQGETGYRVERSTDGANFTQIATTSANLNAYNDSGVSANRGYVYRITPLTSLGDGLAASLLIQAGTRWTTSALATKARGSSFVALGWNDFASETGYRIERTTNGVTGWTSVITLPAGRTTWVDTAVSQLTEYYYRVVAVLPVSEILSSAIAFSASLPASPLPAGWNSADVGSVGGWGIGGSVDGGSTFKVIGGGTQIGGSADSFHYLYRPLNGDGSITVRVASQKNNDIDDNAEAGIMIRESLASGSRYVFVNVEPGRNGRTDLESRASTGGGITNTTGLSNRAPIWMRLTRAGNLFTAEASTNGSTWTTLGTRTITMAAPVYIGMAASAIESNLMSWANFASVSLSGDTTANQPPMIVSPAFPSPATPVTGTTVGLATTAWDDGGESALTYTWSAISVPAGKPAPTFSASNGTNAGKSVTATFGGTGTYTFRVTVTDAGGLTNASNVNVIVLPTLASIAVATSSPTVAPGASVTATATGIDQFGDTVTNPAVTWSAYGGTITSGGVFTAGPNAGTIEITATSGSVSGSAQVTIDFISTLQRFTMESGQATIWITFNSDLWQYTMPSAFVLTNLTTSTVIPSEDLWLGWHGATNRAQFTYIPSILPEGRYSLTASTDDIFSGSQQNLAVPIHYEFVFVLGDLTDDGEVSFDDILILAQNYGQGPRNYRQGDLNEDGLVNFDDLLIMAQRYQTTPAILAPKSATKRRGGAADSSLTDVLG